MKDILDIRLTLCYYMSEMNKYVATLRVETRGAFDVCPEMAVWYSTICYGINEKIAKLVFVGIYA